MLAWEVEPLDSNTSETRRIVYGKSAFRRNDLGERALAKSTVTDFAAAWRTQRTSFPYAERREIIMVHEALRFLWTDAVQNLNVSQRTQRTDAERLRLATSEQAGAMRARQEVNVAVDGTDLIQTASIRTNLLMSDQATDFFLNDVIERFLNIAHVTWSIRIDVLEVGNRLAVDGINRFLAGMLLFNTDCFHEACRCVSANSCAHFLVNRVENDLHFLLAAQSRQLFDSSDDLLDLIMAEHDRFQHNFLGNLVRFRLHHHDGILRSGYDHMNVALLFLLNGRIHDELTVYTANDDSADRSVKRNVGDAQSCAGTIIAAISGGQF